jgi:predicted ATPase
MAPQAISYWLKAGQNALQRSALVEGISQLTKGIELLTTIEDEKVRAELELGLQATLALALAAAKGYAAPEVEQAYGRAHVLCDQIGNAPQLFPVLHGLFAFQLVRGYLQSACLSAEELLSIAKRTEDPAFLLIANGSLGLVNWHMAHNKIALDYLIKANDRYDEVDHAPLALRFGQDFGVVTLSYLHFAQPILGYADKGLLAGTAAIALARRLNHPLSLCAALALYATNMFFRRDPAAALPFAEECIAVASELGFPYWFTMATIVRGWSLAQLGTVGDGIHQIRDAIAGFRAAGTDLGLPAAFTFLAETQLASGQPEAALETTAEALTCIDTNKEVQYEGLVRCCRGDVFCALGDPEHGCAEYETALFAARRQEARWWELRAAVGLATRWHDQGKCTEARDLLAPIYGWFTEGFDTRDLKEAKALLEELAA